ncbi:fungal-specific transcription factor domain-containing protein [Limtongia smithiae]|uniref:fungal-specific transcription factor domain-containing protein n=1 Tax=Limtongia smithiae TaxID=1125753 RepID=UPI0034CE1717
MDPLFRPGDHAAAGAMPQATRSPQQQFPPPALQLPVEEHHAQSATPLQSAPPPAPPAPTPQKIVRVRSGCWTCKARRRKCDEAKPFCMNCIKNNRQCEGYDLRLSFDVDDSRHVASGVHFDVKGRPVVGFRRRPRLRESLAARSGPGAGPTDVAILTPGFGPGAQAQAVAAPAPPSRPAPPPAAPLAVAQAAPSAASTVTTPTKSSKELKFVVQSGFDNAKRPRKRRSPSDTGVDRRSVKDEPVEGITLPIITPSAFLSAPVFATAGHSPTDFSSPSSATSPSTLLPPSTLPSPVPVVPVSTPPITLTPPVPVVPVVAPVPAPKPEKVDNEDLVEVVRAVNRRGPVANFPPRHFPRGLPPAANPSSPAVGRELGLFWQIKPQEQHLLNYFFSDVSPLLDNLKNSPLAGLAITYCNHELALSSFLCLSSLHFAVRHSNESYYHTGLEYHSRTIKFLGDVLNDVSNPQPQSGLSSAISAELQIHGPARPPHMQDTPLSVFSIRNQPKTGRGLGVAVLTVIYFLITFEILDTGKSSTVRSHLAAFASIIEDRTLAAEILSAPNGMFLFRIFAWYDIILAACSKDYRAPHLSGPYFFPLSADDSGVEGIMGCPDEILLAISDTCHLRHRMKYNPDTLSLAEIQQRTGDIESRIRNYSGMRKWDGRESYSYVQHVIGSQCWAQASMIFLLRSTGMDPSGRRVAKCLEEFQKLHRILEVNSEPDRQMVWPMFVVGCELKSAEDRRRADERMDLLFQSTFCGSWQITKAVLHALWAKNGAETWEDVLSAPEWANFDYLAL